MDLYQAIFVEPWPWWGAALAISLFGTALLAVEGRRLGVSGGLSAALGLAPPTASACGGQEGKKGSRWRGLFLIGLPIGGLLATLPGGWAPTLSMGMLDSYAGSFGAEGALLVAGGVLIGFGTRQGGGCTSGHGITGCALTQPNSLASTVMFFAVAALVANVVRMIGGA